MVLTREKTQDHRQTDGRARNTSTCFRVIGIDRDVCVFGLCLCCVCVCVAVDEVRSFGVTYLFLARVCLSTAVELSMVLSRLIDGMVLELSHTGWNSIYEVRLSLNLYLN